MKLVVEPDKGWAWVVAFAACFINMIMSGLSRIVSMLYVEVINTYQVSRQDATIPFSVRNAIRCISGPLVGFAGQRFKIRNVTFWGGVVSAIGGSLCSIAPNVFWLTIFWGIINGFGFAFGNTLFVLVVNQYFDKHKTTACGIALSGGCLGCLIFPFILEIIIAHFNMAGTFLILGGIIMQVLPPALIMESPPWITSQKRKKLKQQGRPSDEADDVTDHGVPAEDMIACKPLRSVSFTGSPADNIQVLKRSTCVKGTSCTNNISQKPNSSDDNLRSEDEAKNNVTSISCTAAEQCAQEKNLTNQNCHQSNGSGLEAISESGVDKEKDEDRTRKHTRNIFVTFGLDFIKLYSNPMYVFLAVCLSSYAILLILVSTIIVDYGQDKGLPESAGKYLIISVAIGDLAGRLCFGWVTDKKFLSAERFISLMFLAQGAFAAAFPLAQGFLPFVVLLALYGIVSGCALVVTPALVVKYTTLDEQPLAMSCLNFLAGFVSFAIPPFIGYFRDDIGSYDGLFLVSGGISILCGFLWFLEPVMLKCQRPKTRQPTLDFIANGN